MSLAFRWEALHKVLPELLPLTYDHWDAIDKRDGFYPDVDRYVAMSESGCAKIFTARRSGVMVGYIIVFIAPDIMRKEKLSATFESVWLSPEARHGLAGYNLIKMCLKSLRKRGVADVITTFKLANLEGRRYSEKNLLARLGFKPYEITYIHDM